MKYNFQFLNSKGFTFIELILYVAIIAIVITTLVPFAWNVIGAGAKSSSEQEVYAQARFISERIKYEIRSAEGVNSVTANQISLETSDPGADPTLIDFAGTDIRIKQGGGEYENLNSDEVRITSGLFVDYGPIDSGTKNIQFSFTIYDNYSGGRQEYDVPEVTIQSSVEVRTN